MILRFNTPLIMIIFTIYILLRMLMVQINSMIPLFFIEIEVVCTFLIVVLKFFIVVCGHLAISLLDSILFTLMGKYLRRHVNCIELEA